MTWKPLWEPVSDKRRNTQKGGTVLCGDCLKLMTQIKKGSVDMVLSDLPYGTTACPWDRPIDLTALWMEYRRVLRSDGAVVLTATAPFTHTLIDSNRKAYRYSWVWNKQFAGNFVQAKRMPLRVHEDVLVFCNNDRVPRYFPVMEVRGIPIKKGGNRPSEAIPIRQTDVAAAFGKSGKVYAEKFPTSILSFNGRKDAAYHPTQKPVALFEYLIRTYTNEGDVVLDNCCGSGTTGVACQNSARHYILMDISKEYIQTTQKRLDDNLRRLQLEVPEWRWNAKKKPL